jgi:hypothetical protein
VIGDIQNALVAWLESERLNGGRLAAVQTVRSGDSDPVYGPDHPILTVDAGEGIDIEAGALDVSLGFPYDLTIYALNQSGADEAVQELGRLLYSLNDGKDRGLIPSLLVLQQRGLRAGGLRFFVRVGNPRTGILRDEMGVTAAAVVPVTVHLQKRISAD